MINLKQIEKDVRAGKSNTIWCSKFTRWWTHLPADVEEATVLGKAALRMKRKKAMRNPSFSDKDKEIVGKQFDMVKNSSVPLDPTGSPITIYERGVEKWIKETAALLIYHNQADMDVLISCHHRNCKHHIPKSWSEAGELLKESKIKPF